MLALLLASAAHASSSPASSPFLASLHASLCADRFSLYALLIIASLSLCLNGFFFLRPQPSNYSLHSLAAVSDSSPSIIPTQSATTPVVAKASGSSRNVHYPSSARMKMVLCVRGDLGMTKGKMCAQCGHAAVGVVDEIQRSSDGKWKEALLQWERKGAMKIALRVGSEEELSLLEAQAASLGLPHYLVVDAGHTQIAPNSQTVLAIGPSPFEELDQITGSLKLL